MPSTLPPNRRALSIFRSSFRRGRNRPRKQSGSCKPTSRSTRRRSPSSTASQLRFSLGSEGRTHVLAAQGDGGERLPSARRFTTPPDAVLPPIHRCIDWSAPLAQAAGTCRPSTRWRRCSRSASTSKPVADCARISRLGHFVWSASRIAASFGLCADEIRREHCGSQARAVYCVHCKTIAQQVRTNVVTCPGCARNLMVRDHYSARLVAYMGFQIDAEVPGALPAIESPYA